MINHELLCMGSDCTGPYMVTFSKPMTVGKFIEEILAAYPDEWGRIDIFTKNRMVASCKYSYGSNEKIYIWPASDINEDTLLAKEIKAIKGDGGWTNSDYDVYI